MLRASGQVVKPAFTERGLFRCRCGGKRTPGRREGRREDRNAEVTMEAWRRAFREGLAPALSDRALLSLKEALEIDDVRLLQGASVSPPPLPCVAKWRAEAACPIGYTGWVGEGLVTIEEVETYF